MRALLIWRMLPRVRALQFAVVAAPPAPVTGVVRSVTSAGKPSLIGNRPYSRAGEVVDRALHAITLAVALRRVDQIVIGCLGFEALYAHTKHRQCVLLIQPDRRFRRFRQVLR